MESTSAISSAFSLHSVAVTCVANCSAFVAPTMTKLNQGCDNSHATASSPTLCPRLVANDCSFSNRLKLESFKKYV